MTSIDPLASLRPVQSWPKPAEAPQPETAARSFPNTVVEWQGNALTVRVDSSVGAYISAGPSPGSVLKATA